MAIHVALHHRTHYRYDKPVGHGPHVVRLRPAPHSRTRILSYSQRITGGPHFIHWQQDPFSNWNARLTFPDPMEELCLEIDLVAEMSVLNPFDFFLEPQATAFPFLYGGSLGRDLEPFFDVGEPPALVLDFLHSTCRILLGTDWAFPLAPSVHRVQTIDFIVALNRRVQETIRYLIRLEPGVQSPETTLRLGSGSCRDSAWLLVHLMRHLGLAARFVSGYLIQLAPDVKPVSGPSGPSSDFTDLHAWCEVYLPGAGWIGLDPTSGLLAGEGHIPLSCTPEPGSAAPVTGGVDPCESHLIHEMSVTRIHESPRVTRPYSEEEWLGIVDLGHRIDADLLRGDVRLTLGGEPTFVSIDDPKGAEWNSTAVSARKRVLSGDLLRRLKRRFAPGALLHYGQGKWYPGEPLPRWALAAFWRKDGVPIWRNDVLIADESVNPGHGPDEALSLVRGICRQLGVDDQWLLPGFEDVFYLTWKERRLPSNVTAEASRLRDRLERDRLARIFQNGVGSVVGYALPLASDPDLGWRSGPWFLRDADTL
ncbi:MAG: transglutaminase family protein, partial [Verrucomicrobiota bacterium]